MMKSAGNSLTLPCYIKYIETEMTMQEAIEARHSVRAYKEQPLTAEA